MTSDITSENSKYVWSYNESNMRGNTEMMGVFNSRQKAIIFMAQRISGFFKEDSIKKALLIIENKLGKPNKKYPVLAFPTDDLPDLEEDDDVEWDGSVYDLEWTRIDDDGDGYDDIYEIVKWYIN